MGAWQRFWATAIIWGSVAAITIVLFDLQANNLPRPFSEMVLLALVLLIMGGAVSATRAVWRAVREIAAQEKAAHATKSKRSHTRRVERLIDALDEEDVYDLEALLQDHDREQQHN
ncbi:MAG: hypothetical protein JXA10_04490 [Anaerolineae bacterium]|nr:hypothetical protein [Anaerolineae bacterium]